MKLLDCCKDVNLAVELDQAARNHVMYGQVLAYKAVLEELGHEVELSTSKLQLFYLVNSCNVDGQKLYYTKPNAE